MSSSGSFEAGYLFDGESWQENVSIEWDDNGVIRAITPLAKSSNPGTVVIPGICNAHSHSFQRIMSGRTERRNVKNPRDSFWTWRETMYSLVEKLDSKDHYRIARYLYMEMLKQGFTSVCEFHYVHLANERGVEGALNQSEGVLKAADETGIGMCFLPVLYEKGGFEKDLSPAQRNFSFRELGDFLNYFRRLGSVKEGTQNLGLAFHSLRACTLDSMQSCLQELKDDLSSIHIHISEQPLEVEQCQEFLGSRPVEYLLKSVDVNKSWNLVHATHLIQEEIEGIADSGASVVLCPATEANLGDGIFPLAKYLELQGRFSIGSDSHIRIDPWEEMRLLEYSQRYANLSRTVVTSNRLPSNGQELMFQLAQSASQASGLRTGFLRVDQRADFLVLDCSQTQLSIESDSGLESLLDRLVFNPPAQALREVYVAGVKRVAEGCHPLEDQIKQDYKETLRKCFP